MLYQVAFVNIFLTVWKVSKYGPEKTPYLDTFHAVVQSGDCTSTSDWDKEMNVLNQTDGRRYTSLRIFSLYTKIVISAGIIIKPGSLCWMPYPLTTTPLHLYPEHKKQLNIDTRITVSRFNRFNKRIHSRKKAPKLKYQKLNVHKLTGKFYEGKGYVCVVKNIAQGPVMRPFYGVSGVRK